MTTSYARAKAKHEAGTRKRAQAAGDDDPGPRTRYACTAEGCQMAGGASAGSGDWCAFHARAQPSDLARITSVMNQHLHLRDAINAARNLLGTDKYSAAFQRAEIAKLSELVQHQGYADLVIDGQDVAIAPLARTESLEGWVYRLQVGLSNIINAELGRRAPLKRQGEMETTE